MAPVTLRELEIIAQACLNLEQEPCLPQDIEIRVLESLEKDSAFRPGLPPGASVSTVHRASKEKRRFWEIIGHLAYKLHSKRYIYGELKNASVDPQEISIQYNLFQTTLSNTSGYIAACLSRLVTENNDENANQATVTREMLDLIGMSLEETRLVKDQSVFKKWAKGLVGVPVRELTSAYDFFQEAQKMSATMRDQKPDYGVVAAALNRSFQKSKLANADKKEAE